MARINEQFDQAVKARLNGQAARVAGHRLDCPAAALAAEAGAEQVARAAAESLGVPYWDELAGRPASREFVATVPIGFARRHGIIGLAGDNGEITVALSDPARWPQLQSLARTFSRPLRPVLAPREQVLAAINAGYEQQGGRAEQVIEQLDRGDVIAQLQQAANEDLLDVAARAPVIKLVNLVLFEAVRARASDVHVQPYEDRLVVRFRIDGILHDIHHPPKALQEEIVSRIKVMGGINIAERRVAQDGRATVEVGDRVIDLRIATLPTSFGERVVIRLLDKGARLYRLGDLGMAEEALERFRRLIRADHGIILVTGPTGSGKSTTLYSALQEINAQELNILTLEDPIEYRLDGISQTQINERKGMNFANGLRHVLRQDPDIIMVGEIRDGETARMAIQSSLTGHLVFSTLHTNDAPSAITRLLDLGVEPYLVASSLLGVLAQRLVRRICPHCRTAWDPTPADMDRWGVAPDRLIDGRLWRGAGCDACLGTGFHERVGIFELLPIGETIREEVLRQAKASTIKALAVKDGMTTLRGDGIAKAVAGVTTMDEVERVSGRDSY